MDKKEQEKILQEHQDSLDNYLRRSNRSSKNQSWSGDKVQELREVLDAENQQLRGSKINVSDETSKIEKLVQYQNIIEESKAEDEEDDHGTKESGRSAPTSHEPTDLNSQNMDLTRRSRPESELKEVEQSLLGTDDQERLMKIVRRKDILGQFTMAADEAEVPITNEILDWRYFNVDYYSHDREYEEV
jgi:hypothetical protein